MTGNLKLNPQKEIETSPIEDKFSNRGRKKSEEIFPDLLDDIKKIVEPECQTDPSFNTCRLYTRLTTTEAIKRLLRIDSYTEDTISKTYKMSSLADLIRKKAACQKTISDST